LGGEPVKKLIAAGVALSALVLALHWVDPNPPVDLKSKPPSDDPQRMIEAARSCNVATDAVEAARPVSAVLSAKVEAEIDPDRRGKELERAVESVSDAELPAMLNALALGAGPGAAEISLLLVRRWAESDPAAAAKWISRLGESPLSRTALEQVAIAWANTDLTAAASWVRVLPEGDSKQAATTGLAYEAARTEPLTALELAGALPPTRERDDLLVHAVSQWAGADASAAAAWAMKVPDSSLRQRLVASVAIALAEQDAVAAVRLAVNGLAAGEEQDRAAVSIVQRWAQHSPQTAASWVAQFPEIPSRDAAVQNLLSIWAAQDSEAAENWRRKL
jgi:hypothetical protein